MIKEDKLFYSHKRGQTRTGNYTAAVFVYTCVCVFSCSQLAANSRFVVQQMSAGEPRATDVSIVWNNLSFLRVEEALKKWHTFGK